MAIKDSREFVERLDKVGEIVRVKQVVDWDCEAGAIVRRTCETQGPAVLFENIKDYPGHRILGASCASFKRVAVGLDLDPEISIRELCDEVYLRAERRIKPVVVAKAPCQENVVTGEDVDLTAFPAPLVHDGDGGRYISTWHFVVTKDPASDWVNWGMYRQMIHSKNLMGGLMLPTSEAGKMKAEYEAKGQNMPFATVIGADPVCLMAGGFPVGPGISEVDVAGGLRGVPVELVKCKTNDLMVPANAEIIIEGEVLRGVTLEEGPFGEFTGYRTAPRTPRPVYKVNCITWRNNPILTMSNMGMPVDDSHVTTVPLGYIIPIRRLLEAQKLPVTGVFVPPEMVGFGIIVGTKVPYNHIATHIAHIVFSVPVLWGYCSKLIVVDDTVDPYNMTEVLHAVATKCHPTRGVTTFPTCGTPLQPYLSLQERLQGHSSHLVLDCTWPVEWDPETEKPPMVSFKHMYTEEMQKKVLENWSSYGFK